jgi:RHS repeat-associated protein
VLTETNGSNTPQSYLTYGNGLLSQGTAASSSRKYPLEDGLGNVRLLSDSAGTVAGSYQYEPFGNLRSQTGIATNYLFDGQQRDTESGLYYLRARYYDPSNGRFLSKDPVKGHLEMPQTLNPYTYVVNNPINLGDPSGRDPFVPGCYPIFFLPVVNAAIIAAAARAIAAGAVITYNYVGAAIGTYLAKSGPQFASEERLAEHIKDHSADMGIAEDQYLRAAQKFFKGDGGKNAEVYTRVNGDKSIFDHSSGNFGVITKDNTIRTFYEPREGYAYWLKDIITNK